MFLTIQEEKIKTEIVEKKSKFIANLFYVRNEQEIQLILKNIKKQYFDARHNCFAYRIMTSDGIVERFSDDGEPSGTAGSPMLNILNKNNLCNVLVVVTRYFGGILLGTGGLVRAYSDVTIKAINTATYANETIGLEVEFEMQYTQLENFKYYCKKYYINIVNIVFESNVKCYAELEQEELNKIIENCNILKYRVVENRNIRKSCI